MHAYILLLSKSIAPAHGLVKCLKLEIIAAKYHSAAMLVIHTKAGNLCLRYQYAKVAIRESQQVLCFLFRFVRSLHIHRIWQHFCQQVSFLIVQTPNNYRPGGFVCQLHRQLNALLHCAPQVGIYLCS